MLFIGFNGRRLRLVRWIVEYLSIELATISHKAKLRGIVSRKNSILITNSRGKEAGRVEAENRPGLLYVACMINTPHRANLLARKYRLCFRAKGASTVRAQLNWAQDQVGN